MMRRHSSFFLPRTFAVAWLGISLSAGILSAGPHIDLVVGPQAPKLQRFAAEELAAQLTKLYGAEAAVVDKATQADAHLVLVGSPATNPAVKQAAGENWPKLSEQGHLLRSVKLDNRDTLLVGGGSPRATLWAAYELGHRLGVRYLLSGDVYPAEPGELKLSGYDVLLEPSLKDRTWVGLGAEPIGMSAWGLEDQKRLLGQLAKLKFNRVVLRFEPWQPFVDFECHGVHKRTAQLWQRESWPIDGETPGRAAFHGVKEFSNPDFAGKTDYEAKTKAGIELARGVLQCARDLGMTTGIALAPFEFPNEFAKTIASRPLQAAGGLAVGCKPGKFLSNAASRKLFETQLFAYLKVYPEVDAIYFSGDDELVTKLEQTMNTAGLVHEFSDKMFTVDGRKVERLIGGQPLKLGNKETTSGSAIELSANTDNAGRRTVQLSLTGTMPRMLPQSSLDELHNVLNGMRVDKLPGFIVDCAMPGDADLYLFYLSRGAFDDKLAPEAACEELVAPMCGPATSERLLLGFRAVERATALADEHDPLFSTLSPDVVMKHYTSDASAPAWWKEAKEGYLTCMTESLRANDRSLPAGRPWLRRLSKRMEFGYEYISAIEQVQLAGEAKRSGDSEAQLTHLEAAVEAMYNALHALGEVAADPSDRGVIAVLAEYGYRPLVAEFEKVQDAADE